jgi:hypothetical protein
MTVHSFPPPHSRFERSAARVDAAGGDPAPMNLNLLACGSIAFSVGSFRQATPASPRSRGSASSVGFDFLGKTGRYSELIDFVLIEKFCKLENVSDDGLLARLKQRFPEQYAMYGADNFKETTLDIEARAEGKCLSMPYRGSAPFGVIRRCLLRLVRLLHAISTSVSWGCRVIVQALKPV